MHRWMSGLLIGVMSLVIVGMARPAAAQDAPKVEVAGGWNYLAARSNEDETWEHLYKGGFGEVAVSLNERFSVVGVVAFDQKTIAEVSGDLKVKAIPYVFGVRMSSRTNAEKATPFLHFLAGATRLSAELEGDEEKKTPFTWMAGGGVNIPVNDRVFARAGADYFRIQGDPENFGVIQGFRLTAGVGVGF